MTNQTSPSHDAEYENKITHGLEELSNSHTCKHDFSLKGMRVVECRNCGLGLFVDGVEDFIKLRDKYGNL